MRICNAGKVVMLCDLVVLRVHHVYWTWLNTRKMVRCLQCFDLFELLCHCDAVSSTALDVDEEHEWEWQANEDG